MANEPEKQFEPRDVEPGDEEQVRGGEDTPDLAEDADDEFDVADDLDDEDDEDEESGI